MRRGAHGFSKNRKAKKPGLCPLPVQRTWTAMKTHVLLQVLSGTCPTLRGDTLAAGGQHSISAGPKNPIWCRPRAVTLYSCPGLQKFRKHLPRCGRMQGKWCPPRHPVSFPTNIVAARSTAVMQHVPAEGKKRTNTVSFFMKLSTKLNLLLSVLFLQCDMHRKMPKPLESHSIICHGPSAWVKTKVASTSHRPVTSSLSSTDPQGNLCPHLKGHLLVLLPFQIYINGIIK